MRDKAITFVRRTIETYKRSLDLYKKTGNFHEGVNNRLADSYARQIETLEMWEHVLRTLEQSLSGISPVIISLDEPPECKWCGGSATHKNNTNEYVCNICEPFERIDGSSEK